MCRFTRFLGSTETAGIEPCRLLFFIFNQIINDKHAYFVGKLPMATYLVRCFLSFSFCFLAWIFNIFLSVATFSILLNSSTYTNLYLTSIMHKSQWRATHFQFWCCNSSKGVLTFVGSFRYIYLSLNFFALFL